ncbi:FkbM family methyltransferase [Nodularia harveyana UHCC-0300]|uniref:FkbM family methyltransferase n=1 Tax=Nodularia harveyana UHCC-0300 TaxID=2974287 RepID=A0ABU5UJ06_9CYAN|nr:FkbM family methyltransferase [Nodularia harveyana]MEA5583333.1 FkbM family methyltransferase [Nodularia harveyana UHCC-0300]
MNSFFWLLIDKFYNKNPQLRKLLITILFGDNNITVNLFDRKLLINSIKENGYYRASRICNTSSLLRDEISVLLNISAILSAGDTFIDVGANIGIFSSLLSRYKSILPDLDIHAFEANPDTYQRLKNNAENYGFKIYNTAISDTEGELEFCEGAVSHVFTTLENASKYNFKNKVTNVKSQRLDRLAIKGNSIILKIDVEGQEMSVLKGASSWFDAKRIKAVYLDGFADKDKQELLNFLRSYNFSLWDGRELVKTDGNLFSLLAIAPENPL